MVAALLGFQAAFIGSAIILALAVVFFKAITANQLKTCPFGERG
jgi:hypothetical protein